MADDDKLDIDGNMDLDKDSEELDSGDDFASGLDQLMEDDELSGDSSDTPTGTENRLPPYRRSKREARGKGRSRQRAVVESWCWEL